jgi:hypothetical protein
LLTVDLLLCYTLKLKASRYVRVKNILRKLGGRTHEALLEVMEGALSKVSAADAAGWFEHCVYQVEVQYL